MKSKLLIVIGIVGLSITNAQENKLVLQYPEELYQYNDNAQLSGTARFQGMSGAMGALGGDLSAAQINPAGPAVFLNSEASITTGVSLSKINPKTSTGLESNKSNLNLNQIGGVLTFEDLNSNEWKNIAISINYQSKNIVNENFSLTPNTVASNGDKLDKYHIIREGLSSVTNFNAAANYKNKLYIGGGINFHSFETNNYESMTLKEGQNRYTYTKDYYPNFKSGSGISLSAGLIGKVNQNIRLGAAYQSPTWYVDNEETVKEYAMYSATDNNGEYYYIGDKTRAYVNSLTTAQKFTGSAAIVLGKNGLISADYTYTNYGSAKFKPENSFKLENAYINSGMKDTNSFRVGAEMRLDAFSLRGGFRYEESPFKNDIDIMGTGEKYQPFGDLTGFSIGAGYKFNGFYVDAAYNLYKRNRSYLISGNFYDKNSSISADGVTQNEALNTLSLNAEESGYGQIINNIKERQGNISLTLGFKF